MDEFLKAWQQFAQHDHSPKVIEFRVYYEPETGRILQYTTEDQPGEYILVDKETFHCNRLDWTVKQGKMCPPPSISRYKLIPDADGTACHAHDITIIAGSQDPVQHWKKHVYED